VLDLLQQTAHLDDDLLVYCDSKYVIDSVTKWMPGWKRKGWKTASGQPVKNVELMKALDAAMRPNVEFKWVKGHSGHVLNEAADVRANAAAAAYQRGDVADPGPGFADSSTAHPAATVGQVEVEPDLFSDFDDAQLSDEEQVIALERSLLTDEVRSDRAAVAALLHPQWQEIGASGRLWNRDDQLDEIGPIEAVTLDVVNLARLTPDLILLVWRASSDDGTRLRSSLWQRTGGQWQQRFHQGTVEA
ncbi:MAG: ribonuclease HI family protein, partial [Nocardioides sp.]|uniref:ribonuclease HI family protein n=1 Tax=Nocardioides sp. TaxID=35761 RepID=UPI0032636917